MPIVNIYKISSDQIKKAPNGKWQLNLPNSVYAKDVLHARLYAGGMVHFDFDDFDPKDKCLFLPSENFPAVLSESDNIYFEIIYKESFCLNILPLFIAFILSLIIYLFLQDLLKDHWIIRFVISSFVGIISFSLIYIYKRLINFKDISN